MNPYLSANCVNEYMAIDSGGNVSDLALACNCCLARILPGEAGWCRNEQVCQGRQKV